MREKTGKIDISRLENLIPSFTSDPGIILVYLFGSYASGVPSALSDVDLALLLTKDVPREKYLDYRLEYLAKTVKALRDDRVDVVILNSAPPLLAHEAIRGRLLFERTPEARVGFEVAAQRKYLDLKPFYAIETEYMRRRMKEGTFGRV